MTDELTVRNLADLTSTEFRRLERLEVSARQEVLGKSFAESLEDWRAAPRDATLGVCFEWQGQPVGLAVFNRVPELKAASIHGLKIALPWQGRGWGHVAFAQAVGRMMEIWPDVDTLRLSVDAENAPALTIYRAFGMVDRVPPCEGPNGMQHLMHVALVR
ncbi:MAG: GNAT family N-acetyltransferase [Pseudomonadota bacterium]